MSDWTGMVWKKLLINPSSMTMDLACLILKGFKRVDACCIGPAHPGADGKYGELDRLYCVPLRVLS